MHRNHRRKHGSHNPRKGQGWSSNDGRNIPWYKMTTARVRRHRAKQLLNTGKWNNIEDKWNTDFSWEVW